MIEQGSVEWHNQRLGKVTASRIKDVMARTKTGYGASRKNYMAELLCQRLTGRREEGFVNAAMQRGTEQEPMARGMYEWLNSLLVMEAAFIGHPSIDMAGASPDGLVGDEGLIEIKCPNSATHIEFLRTGLIDPDYVLQMQFQMMCTGRKWCDFVSFDNRMPDELQYKCVRVPFDEMKAAEIRREVVLFLADLDVLEAEMRGLMTPEAA